MTKNIYFLFALFLLFFISSFSYENKKCTSTNLYGKWKFITNYQGKVSDIEKVKNDSMKWPDMEKSMTFSENGEYRFIEDDMIGKENFLVDTINCRIKFFLKNQHWKDTTSAEIAYLDKDYLLYIEKFDSFYFTSLYKKE